MKEQKRFKSQKLDSKDYEKTEEGAKLLKNGGLVLSALLFTGGVIKKCGPKILKGINAIRKI